MSTSGRALILCLCVVLAGCADDDYGQPPPDFGPLLLVVVNQGTGEDRPLEELMLHAMASNYHTAQNRLEAPLRVGERVELDSIQRGYHYLTVIRKKLSLEDVDRVALTTSEKLDLRGGICEVWVFDESFRIFAPKANKGDAGPDGPVTGLDASGPDGRQDAAVDVGFDLFFDASIDAASDVSTDTGSDAVSDASSDDATDGP